MINEVIDRITIKMYETEDKFIVETILPYCSEIEQITINKKDLIDALEKQIPKKPNIETTKPYFIAYCCNCGHKLIPSKYCDHCGQAIDWSELNGSK